MLPLPMFETPMINEFLNSELSTQGNVSAQVLVQFKTRIILLVNCLVPYESISLHLYS